MKVARRRSSAGFSNQNFERRFYVVNLGDLERFDAGTTVDAPALEAAGLIPDEKQPVKILGEGELTKKLTVVGGKFSHSAHDKIIALGGACQTVKGEAFAFPKIKKKFIPREPVKKAKKIEEAPAEAKAAEVKAPEVKAAE
jgi:hypothetical protein